MWKLLNGVIRFFRPEDVDAEDDQPIIQAVSRRGFLQGLGAIAIAQAIPFNRVWSFPTIIKPKWNEICPVGFRFPIDFTRLDAINRTTWSRVPWDADIQLFGGAIPESLGRTATGSDLVADYARQTVAQAMFQFEDQVRSAVAARAHRILPLPD